MGLDPQSPKDRYIIDYILKHEQRYDYYAVPIVLMEDDIVHDDLHPFCDDVAGCFCHRDTVRFWQYCDTPYLEGLITKAEQYRIFYGEQLVPRSEDGRP